MGDLKNPKLAIPVVLMAGIIWSFGPYVVRNIDEAHTVPWQYLFTRGMVIFILLNIYLYMEEGLNFINNYKKIGVSGLLGGCGLAIAMITFIWSITNTTTAITLLCLAAMPFITALLGFLFLKGKLSFSKKGIAEFETHKGQESFRIKPFTKSNAWGLFPSGKDKFKKGDFIECYTLTGINSIYIVQSKFVVDFVNWY